ncbi:MAG: cytochrome c-type biogenesis protein [Acidiferrobacterales bacterium]
MSLNKLLKYFLISSALLFSLGLLIQKNAAAAPVATAADPLVFTDAKKEARYKNLIGQLRCLVCQNQSIAESNAELARDLRKEVYNMIMAGKSDQEAIDFLVARYGNFILYRPPLNTQTFLLWFLPGILVILALILVIGIIKKRSRENQKVVLDENAENRLNKLIGPKV